jgi:hypothetical protein
MGYPFASAGLWTQQAKADAGVDFDHACPHCQTPHQDFLHLLCDCKHPSLVAIRAKYFDQFGDVNLRLINSSILVGLPYAMSGDPATTFWGQEESELQDLPPIMRKFLGCNAITHKPFGLHIESLIKHSNCNGYRDVGDGGLNLSFCNARQLSLHIWPYTCYDQAPQLSFQDCGTAPDHPNHYTDGSVLHPDSTLAQLAAAASWDGARTLNTTPVTELESAVTDEQGIFAGGHGMRVATRSFKTSSTRAEILGGLLSLSSPGAKHIGADNKAFVSTANRMLNEVSPFRSKPWQL